MGKAIPLRRSRTRAGGTPARLDSGWTRGLRGALRRAIGGPRQVWLAGLGVTVLAVRGGTALWARLVAEGAEAEGAILDALPRGGAERAG